MHKTPTFVSFEGVNKFGKQPYSQFCLRDWFPNLNPLPIAFGGTVEDICHHIKVRPL